MATNRWRGDAPAVARVVTLTVGGTPANGDAISYSINGKAITYTLGASDDEVTAAAGLYALLAASQIPEFKEVSWSYTEADDFLTGTAATPGVPWEGTASDTGTTTLTEAEATASSGPNHVDRAANWSLGSLPAAAEDVLVDGGPDLLYGFEGLTAAAYASLRVKASFGGAVGLPFRTQAGYVEYRERFFPVGSAVPVTIGEGDGTGPLRVNLDVDTALDLTVLATGQRPDATVPAVNVVGCSSGTLNLAAGDAGLAAEDDTTVATVTTARVDGDATLTVGKGATAATVCQTGGTVRGLGGVTTLNQTAGSAVLYSPPTTVTTDGGEVDCRFTGTVTTVTARGQGEQQANPQIICTNDPRPKTFGTSSFTGGAPLIDSDKSVTFTNPATFDRLSLARSDLGARMSLQRT